MLLYTSIYIDKFIWLDERKNKTIFEWVDLINWNYKNALDIISLGVDREFNIKTNQKKDNDHNNNKK